MDNVTVKFLSPRNVPIWAKALLSIALIFYGWNAIKVGVYENPPPNPTPEQLRHPKNGNDFTAYYSAGELARKGQNIYRYENSSTPSRPFIYPAMFAVFPMALLSLLSHNVALGVFGALNIVLFLASLWILRGLLWTDGETLPPSPTTRPARSILAWGGWRRPEMGLLFTIIVCSRWIHANLRLGQSNLIIAFLILSGLYLLVQRRAFSSGLTIALATAYKVTPGLFGAFFFWTWRPRSMLGGAVGLVAFLFLVPSLLLGFDLNLSLLKIYAGHVTHKLVTPKGGEATESEEYVGYVKGRKKPQSEDESLGVASGISFRGTLMKVLSPTKSIDHVKPGETPSVNIANFTPDTAKNIANVVSLLCLLFTIWMTFSPALRDDRLGLCLSWSLTALTMLLVSPLTRSAHLAITILPFFAIITLLQKGTLRPMTRRLAWAAVLLPSLVGTLFSTDVIGERIAERAHALGFATLSLVVAYITIALALRQRKAELTQAVAKPQ